MGRLRDPSSPRRRPLGSAARLFRFARLAMLGLERRELPFGLLRSMLSLMFGLALTRDATLCEDSTLNRGPLFLLQKGDLGLVGFGATFGPGVVDLRLGQASLQRRFVVSDEGECVGRAGNERNSGQKDGTEQFFEMIHLLGSFARSSNDCHFKPLTILRILYTLFLF